MSLNTATDSSSAPLPALALFDDPGHLIIQPADNVHSFEYAGRDIILHTALSWDPRNDTSKFLVKATCTDPTLAHIVNEHLPPFLDSTQHSTNDQSWGLHKPAYSVAQSWGGSCREAAERAFEALDRNLMLDIGHEGLKKVSTGGVSMLRAYLGDQGVERSSGAGEGQQGRYFCKQFARHKGTHGWHTKPCFDVADASIAQELLPDMQYLGLTAWDEVVPGPEDVAVISSDGFGATETCRLLYDDLTKSTAETAQWAPQALPWSKADLP